MDIYATLASLKEAYRGEALFRPSSIGRVIACPGSVKLIARAGRRRAPSKYAMEGSAAHIVAEQALKGIRQPDEWTDRMVKLDQGGMHGEFVSSEMVDAVEEYVDDVRQRASQMGAELFIEHHMTLGVLDPNDPIMAQNRGTGDVVILNRLKQKITIKDFKYGKGVMVSASAPQVQNYGILAILSFPDTIWKEVEMVISQPRAVQENQRLKVISFDPVDLMTDFMGKLMEGMHVSLGADPPLKTGSHCRWCPAKDAGICPAIQQEAMQISRETSELLPPMSASTVMGPIPSAVHFGTIDAPAPVTPVPNTVILPPAINLTPDNIAAILDRRHLWDLWIESVEMRASQLLEAGVAVPGWMLSPRTGNRRWKDKEEDTAAKLREIGVKTAEMYTRPKLVSPAQIEKILKKEYKPLIGPLVERPQGSPVLMRATEAREQPPATTMGAIE